MTRSKPFDETPKVGDRSVRIKTGAKISPTLTLLRPQNSSGDCFLFFKSEIVRKSRLSLKGEKKSTSGIHRLLADTVPLGSRRRRSAPTTTRMSSRGSSFPRTRGPLLEYMFCKMKIFMIKIERLV